VEEVHSLVDKYQNKAHFLTIYIREAHPQDLWPLGQHVVVNSHKTIADRIDVAKQFIAANHWKLEMVVDTLQDLFMKEYWSHPERFYVVLDNKLVFKAQPQDAHYPVSDLVSWLEKYFS